MAQPTTPTSTDTPRGPLAAFLGWIERVGNKLPDPALLFFLLMLATWVISALLSGSPFEGTDRATGATTTLLNPRTGEPLMVENLLAPKALLAFLQSMVSTFMNFAPLGVVLVALLGVGVAESTGLINAALKGLLDFTPQQLLTPALILVAILSHSAVDAGYVLVIPLGAVIFHGAGRHPLAGIAAAFAGVSGGFSANPVPSALDPLLQGFTQGAAQILDPARLVNPLCNIYFTGASTLLIVLVGWWLTDKVIEPRLKNTPIDGDDAEAPALGEVTKAERRGLLAAFVVLLLCIGALVAVAAPETSVLRDSLGSLTSINAPLMKIIVPLILLFFLAPAIAFGIAAGTVKTHRDVIQGMSKSMAGMGYYLVMAFFCALFLDAFTRSNLGALLALKGAGILTALGLPGQVTIVGIIGLTGGVNLVLGSASAKWGLLSPIFVPMLMELGISPELTQAAYRVGDSCTNIITPLMPYFPLVVVFCKRYTKSTGIGTLISLMLPYSILFLVAWTLFLLAFWTLGIPLGPDVIYSYPN
ncbi:MAG: AbgT family transporter [Planctomycetaceae bacterium]|nr:AbgT family transporter [Planctomycetaceae bacterium]